MPTYTFFAERYQASLFKKTVLIFDNAGKLLQYIQNRDPDLFAGEELQSCTSLTIVNHH